MSRRGPIVIISLLGVAAAIVFFLRAPQVSPGSPGPGGRAVVQPQQVDPARGGSADAEARMGEASPAAPVREDAPQAPNGEIAGRVISSETRGPVAGAEVTWSSARGAHSARTDGEGRFTFRPPEAGEYQLASAKADGFLPFGPEWGKSPVSITFRPGQRVRGVSVELEPAPELEGRVVDAKGQPAPRSSVRVLVPRRDELALFPMRDRFTTDARGVFTFRAPPYAMVEAFHPTLGSGSERLEAGAKQLVVTLEPSVADAGARSALKGRVVLAGDGVAGAAVHVSSALAAFPRVYGSSDGYRELTGEDGRFEITDLPPGTYDVSAHLLGTAPSHRFDVVVPAKAELQLELGSGPKLEGRVTDEAGGAVPSFELSLRWRKAPLERLTIVEAGFVDPDGRYLVEGIAPGEYELEVRAAGFTAATSRVTLKSDVTADVTLKRGVRVVGIVRDAETRAAISGAKVALEGRDVATVTDGAGGFVLEGMAADGFSLQASAPGHNTKVLGVTQASAPVEIELTPVAPDAGPKTELAGIGLVLRGRGDALVVGQVMPSGGGAAAGLQPGDELTAVSGQLVAELGFEPAIRSIRGPVGSTVELVVRKAGKTPPVSVIAMRKKITN